MFRRQIIRVAVLASLILTSSCASPRARRPMPPDPAAVAANPGVQKISTASNDFGFRLLRRLVADKPTGNVFFSPFSISQALTLTLSGADGQTRTDMARTLGLAALPPRQINAANALLLPSLQNPDPKIEVSVANALWANRGVVFAPQFQADAKRLYSAQATTIDFGTPAGAQTINAWVSANTQGKITQIVSAGNIAHASAVLTNAVYFHGLWQSPFDKAATTDAPFHLSKSRTKTVPLMSQEASFAYLQTPQFQAVSLPYGTGRLSLLVFLPSPGTSLNAFVSGLNSGRLDEWRGAMRPAEMTLLLPRFGADYTVTLNKSLTALGMGSAFSGGADFGPMGLPGAHISAVLHKAVLQVDEEGTTAAATTAVEMDIKVFRPATVVRVDRPFFCVLRDSVTGAILFEGVIRDPE